MRPVAATLSLHVGIRFLPNLSKNCLIAEQLKIGAKPVIAFVQVAHTSARPAMAEAMESVQICRSAGNFLYI